MSVLSPFFGNSSELLRQHGHDVDWIRTDSPGMDDQDVMARAVAEQRVLLTCDQDSAYPAFRLGATASCGIVLVRISPSSVGAVARTALSVLESLADRTGHFSATEETRIRMTALP